MIEKNKYYIIVKPNSLNCHFDAKIIPIYSKVDILGCLASK